MKIKNVSRLAAGVCVLFVAGGIAAAQKPVKPIIFAVLSDGTSAEPIAYVNKGKLEAAVGGDASPNVISAFDKAYYKPGTVYKLIFGGANVGTVTAKSSDPKAECSKNMGTVTTKSSKVTLKGLVMGLATSAPIKSTTGSFRRKPTDAEKAEMDALAKAEYAKQKLTPKLLHYQNLTAIDVDNDGKPEFVASYWIEIDKLTRGLLFFIAQRGSNGKYSIGYREYRTIDQSGLMSGASLKDIDEGTLHELLLDSYDYDGDGTGEIFTYKQSFEGAGFTVYKRNGSKWAKAFEGSNYHCGF
ncbi:MAG: hypothetical protein JO053_12340 [Acidobacteria bacterium]|nr:hypothetical protein [Acidobacteriota bacterium]